ncbi:MAG: hypothetical protein AMXMBFR80_20530 [Dehalococcoidia bacterium]|nr:hypothetical protein [Tepidiformaceae bacterium]
METPIGPGPAGMNLNHIKVCARCSLRYDWRKSPSSMKMTYCSSLCEKADLGFTLEALLRYERVKTVGEEEKEPAAPVV